MRNQFVILAGGKGTRMGTLSVPKTPLSGVGGGSVPKVLVMLKNKPLILHLLHELEKITQLIKPVVVVGYENKKVEGVLGDSFFYALQQDQLGTAHALLCAKRKIKAENILVLYGDMPFIKAGSLRELIRMHLKSTSNISICTAQVENFSGIYKSLEHYGRILRDPISRTAGGIVEYKDASPKQKEIKEVAAGIFMFNTKWLWANIEKIKNESAQKEYYLTDLVALAAGAGETVQALPIDPKEAIGVNSKEDLEVAEKILEKHP